MHSVELTPTAEDVYEWLHKRDAKLFERVRTILMSLGGDPVQGKPLKGELKGRFSFRLGAYRIIYRIVKAGKRVVILDIAHRRDVYR